MPLGNVLGLRKRLSENVVNVTGAAGEQHGPLAFSGMSAFSSCGPPVAEKLPNFHKTIADFADDVLQDLADAASYSRQTSSYRAGSSRSRASFLTVRASRVRRGAMSRAMEARSLLIRFFNGIRRVGTLVRLLPDGGAVHDASASSAASRPWNFLLGFLWSTPGCWFSWFPPLPRGAQARSRALPGC